MKAGRHFVRKRFISHDFAAGLKGRLGEIGRVVVAAAGSGSCAFKTYIVGSM
jgi:hypothetical protein